MNLLKARLSPFFDWIVQFLCVKNIHYVVPITYPQ